MRVVKKKSKQRYLYFVSDNRGFGACLVCAESAAKAKELSKFPNASAVYLGVAKCALDEEVLLTFISP